MKSFLLASLVSVLFFSLSMIAIRLHLTQLAYSFDDMKEYERSLKEEQLRMRAQLAEKLSPHHLYLDGFQEPKSDQVRVIP